TWTRASRASRKPAVAIANTGKRSLAKISRRSAAASVTSEHHIYCGTMRPFDVGALLDEGRWTTYQKLLVFGTALTIILDGVDNQLLPNTIPTLIKEWGLPRAAFINALASGPFGMMIGGLLGGVMGDRVGRRAALLASVVTLGRLTSC